MTNNNNTYIYNTRIIRKSAIWITLVICFLRVEAQEQVQIANEYLLKGDKTKALDLYRELSKNESNIPFIHNNYVNILLDLGKYDEAQAYLKKAIKQDPQNLQYRLDVGLTMTRAGDESKADKYFRELISENKDNVQRVKLISDYFLSRSLTDYGILTLTESRIALGSPSLFCLDLAMLYRVKGNQDKMVQEYLSYVTQSAANIQYVKNVLQTLLTKQEELESLALRNFAS